MNIHDNKIAIGTGGSQAIDRGIAGPITFLTSDDARFVTGQTLVADGGWLGR